MFLIQSQTLLVDSSFIYSIGTRMIDDFTVTNLLKKLVIDTNFILLLGEKK